MTAVLAAASVARKQAVSGGAQALAGKAAVASSAKATLTTTATGVSLNFTGTNGAAPPAPLTLIQATAGSTGTIQSNQLRFHLAALGGYADVVRYGFTPSSNDYTITFDLELNATTGEQFTYLQFREDGADASDYVSYGIDSGGFAYIDAGTRVAPTDTSLGGAGGLTITAATVMHVKINRRGTTFQVRYWMDAASEPGTWNLVDTTSAANTAGRIVAHSQGGAVGATHDHDWDNLTVVY